MDYEEFAVPDELQPLTDKLAEVFRSIPADREIDEERFQIFQKVAFGMAFLFGVNARMSLHPKFAAGGISVKVPSFKLNAEANGHLADIIKDCDTFGISPLVDGNIDVDVTVRHIYK